MNRPDRSHEQEAEIKVQKEMSHWQERYAMNISTKFQTISGYVQDGIKEENAVRVCLCHICFFIRQRKKICVAISHRRNQDHAAI